MGCPRLQRSGRRQANDRLHRSLLTVLIGRDLAIGVVADDSGTVRVVFDPPMWDTFLDSGVDEIDGAEMHPMMRARLQLLLERLFAAPEERRVPIERRIGAFADTA